MVESCLPVSILRAWQRSTVRKEKDESNELQRLMSFLKDEVEGETRILLAHQGFSTESSQKESKGQKAITSPKTKVAKEQKDRAEQPTAIGLHSKPEGGMCGFCNRKHATHECRTALSWTLNERKDKLRSTGSCYKCLRRGHLSSKCNASVNCSQCGREHYEILCLGGRGIKDKTLIEPDPTRRECRPSGEEDGEPGPSRSPASSTTSNLLGIDDVVMWTLQVRVTGGKHDMIARAFIDPGSQHSYITERLAKDMGYLPKRKTTFSHALFGGEVTQQQQHSLYEIEIADKNGKNKFRLDAFDQAKITSGDISSPGDNGLLYSLRRHGIELSDSGKKNLPIEILIGVDVFGKLLTGNVRQLPGGLTAIETTLGWILGGKTGSQRKSRTETNASIIVASSMNKSTLTDLWELETIGIRDPAEKLQKQDLDEQALSHFRKTVTRRETGGYCVALPWIEGHPPLPNYYESAKKRLESTTRKLVKLGKFKEYDDVFREWKELGIIEEVDNAQTEQPCTYLPHRAVIKESSATTKVRPVFDASCNGAISGRNTTPSLNECLVKGPNLLEKIQDLLLRFRVNPVAAIADIKKAFLMIEVDEHDRDFLRFLWWGENNTSIRTYRHCRVVFGLNCSPFLLGAVIEFHLKANTSDKNEKIMQKLQSSLYVDNVVASFTTVEEYEAFREESVKVLSDANFDLRLWETNCDTLMENKIANVLGMGWNKLNDTLHCKADLEGLDLSKISKKTLLSAIARIFDPLGMLAPVTLQPKRLFQRCWGNKLKWDDPVDPETEIEFRKWIDGMKNISSFSMPRWFSPLTHTSSIHIFGDASEIGYAAVAFHRAETRTGIEVNFMISRSRVAPLKRTTINRLELIACEISARLGETIKTTLGWERVPIIYWTDSATAKAWIQRNKEWGTFVGNRVRSILNLTDASQWRHVPGKMNPADLPSRGCNLDDLKSYNWGEGPDWLRLDSSTWPKQTEIWNENEINLELKKSALALTNLVEEPWYHPEKCRIGNYCGLVRVRAWMNRFIQNSLKTQTTPGPLSRAEIIRGERLLWRDVQAETELDLKSFPFQTKIDKFGLARVETKLTFRKDDENFKSPIIVPGNHYISQLLIREVHEKNGHAGTNFLMGNLRERVWLTGARQAITKVIRSCVTCQRFRIKPPEPKTAPLPEDRVRDASPFEVTGVDYAGPLYLKDGKKVWVALYTCAVYRGVHLELVDSLSTEAFLQSFRRFIARRGRPAVVYSDNGTNFNGASRLLRQINWNEIEKATSTEPIKWIFTAPSAPWWGGWWERLVRTMKGLLVRILGKKTVSHEELTTILCDVEATINGRPLSHVYEGDTMVPLTPSMFLTGVREAGVPDLDEIDERKLQKRHRLQKRLMEDLRARFRKEYLSQLVQRRKEERTTELRVDDVVLIGADNTKRVLWPTGVITELIRGRDGVVRTARVKTDSGELLRPIQRLYPLELSCHETIPEERIQEVIKTRSGRTVRKPIKLDL